jgi:hypothetical protein
MIINTISNSNTCIGICRNSSRKHLFFRSGIISRIITGITTGITTGIIFCTTICISSSSPAPSSLSLPYPFLIHSTINPLERL